MKRFIALFLCVFMALTLAACGAGEQSDDGSYVIGICQYMPHPASDMATQGFMDAVTAELGASVTFDNQNAAGETANCSTILNGLVASNVDLILANATPSVIAAYNATEDIPVLGTCITEYGVALGIEDFSGTVGSNVSGTSDLADLEKQAQMVLDWCPEAKNVGLLYCSAEPNSNYQIRQVQAYLEGKGLKCQRFAFADTGDLMAVTREAADSSDVIYIPTDNTAATHAAAIDSVCRPAKVPIIAGEAGTFKACGIATMSIDYYDLGYATGKMAIRVLRDGEDISQMPIEYAPGATYYYNEEICAELGIEPLDGYEKLANE